MRKGALAMVLTLLCSVLGCALGGLIGGCGGSGGDSFGNHGHIFLSTFQNADPGNYKLRGFHVKTVIDIGEEAHVADATISMIN